MRVRRGLSIRRPRVRRAKFFVDGAAALAPRSARMDLGRPDFSRPNAVRSPGGPPAFFFVTRGGSPGTRPWPLGTRRWLKGIRTAGTGTRTASKGALGWLQGTRTSCTGARTSFTGARTPCTGVRTSCTGARTARTGALKLIEHVMVTLDFPRFSAT